MSNEIGFSYVNKEGELWFTLSSFPGIEFRYTNVIVNEDFIENDDGTNNVNYQLKVQSTEQLTPDEFWTTVNSSEFNHQTSELFSSIIHSS